jgi:hypothetical protein
MDDPKLTPLDYRPSPRKAEERILPIWLPFALLSLQFIWCLPAGFWSMDILGDGSPKRPFFDIGVYAASVVPSIAAMLVGLGQCRTIYRRESSIKNCAVTILAILLAALVVGMSLYSWIDDDLVNRSIPHGLW